jgi:hypothetical protein
VIDIIVFLGAIFIILYFVGCFMKGLAIGNLAKGKFPRHECFNQTGFPRCQICGKVLPHRCHGDGFCAVCGKKMKP